MPGWIVIGRRGGDQHIIPRDDLAPHIESRACPCRPTPDPDEPRVIIHHSADMREHYEAARPS
jgi:hypothetical protein